MAIQRKRGARALAMLGAVAMLATACGDDSGDGDSTADEASEAPSTAEDTSDSEAPSETGGSAAEGECGATGLVWAHEQEPPDMHLDDPNNNLSITSWIRQSMWEGLHGVSADTQFFPEMLAEDLEVVENDDDSVTFNGTLRDGLTWSDGTAVTAQQVVDTHAIIMEGVGDDGTGGVYLIGDRTGYDVITDIEATSDTEFTFTMSEFFAGYKALFDPIMPTHVVADAAAANEAFASFEANGEPLPSTGPMLWESWDVGSTMELTTNEDYHGSVSPDVTNDGAACVTGVTINFVPDTDTQINALQAGEADIIFTQPQLQFEEALASNDQFTVASEPGPVYEHWGFNLYNPHLADPLVREAMAVAMNKEEVMTGLYTPLFGDILPTSGLGNSYWMSNQEDYVDNAGEAGFGQGDVEGARALLEEAGYTDNGGTYEHPERGPLNLRVGTTGGNGLRELQQQILQQQYAQAGIGIEINNTDGGAYFSEQPFAPAALACAMGTPDGESSGEGEEAVTADCGIWDITQFAWVGGPWPGGNSAAFRSGSGNNPYGYANEEFDAKANECDLTLDDAERATCYNELDAFVTTAGPDGNGLVILPLTQKPSFYAYSNERLAGAAVSPDANQAGPLVNVVDYQPVGG